VLRSYLWLLFLSLAPKLVAEPQECPHIDGPWVVIDEFIFSEPGGTNADVLSHYFDVPEDKCLSRADLDQGLSEARTRLEALGEYKKINIALRKGQVRDHYIVAVELEPESPYYFGAGLTMSRQNRATSLSDGYTRNDPSKYKALVTDLYVGNRNLFNSQARIDFNASYEEIRDENNYDDDYRSHVSQYNNFLTLNFFHPNFLFKNFVLGTTFYRLHYFYRYDTNFSTSTAGDDYDSYKFALDGFYSSLKFGYRWKLLTVTPNISRITVHANDDGDYSTYVGVSATFTNKTFLVAVEPGIFAKLSYTRQSAPKWQPPNYHLVAESSHIFLSRLGLTPEVMANFDYYYYDNQPSLFRHYEPGLRLDYIATENLILQAKAAAILEKSGDEDEPETFARRFQTSLIYLTTGMRFDLTFILGDKGAFSFDDFDKRRIGE
jgi:hypothetical protein